jgi:hypothetical protein
MCGSSSSVFRRYQMKCESLVGPVHQMLDLEQDEQHRLPEVEADMHLTLEESRDIPLAQFAQAQLQHVMTPEVTVFEAPIGHVATPSMNGRSSASTQGFAAIGRRLRKRKIKHGKQSSITLDL